MGFEEVEKLGYKQLKDLKFQVDIKGNSFAVCFWVYLPKSIPIPCTILHQSHSAYPFLRLGKDKRLHFAPSVSLVDDETDSSKTGPSLISEMEFPLEEWVHLGFEVCSNGLRIHLNGKVVGEKLSKSSPAKDSIFQSVMRVILFAKLEGFENLKGYIYNPEVLPSTSSISNHYVKDPPVRLCVDSASASGVELESDGIWNIGGGKVSCRTIFSLDILLLDAFGQPVHEELKIIASLVYADDWSPVEKSEGDQAPLLSICDGLEYSSGDLPSKLSQGRASFKMKISQLSPKCNDKLFRIKFDVPELGNHPFLEAFTPPIRCTPKASNAKMSTITWKKLPSGIHLFSGSSSPQYGVGHSDLQQNAMGETTPDPPSKRVKVGQDIPMEDIKADTSVKQPEEECSSYRESENMVTSTIGTSLECIQENYGGMDNSTSDSDSGCARDSELKNMPCSEELLSDLSIFRYCLGSLSERLAMLKEISVFASEPDIIDMAEKVAFFSGCTHHRHQILIAKRLLEEGEKVWNMIARDSQRVNWDNVVFEIEEQFMRIACCNTRSLTQQDLNFLRRSFGGREYMTKDDFDKMWRWLYPVAFTISRQEINSVWAATLPKWIEAFVTKEEVDYALQSPLGISEPGTFILRFPTTRSWPHPDAGSLVASYVGRDFSLHHRQLSLDYSTGMFESNPKPLQELILSEPEFSRVARMMRSNLTV